MKLVVLLVVLAACGPKAVFRLSSDENNSFELGRTLDKRKLPPAPTPVNAAGKPRVFAVTAGSGPNKTIISYDIASGNVMWKADADVRSRIVVGGDVIVALEGKQVVARDQGTGQPRWRADAKGTFIGAAADRERVYVVYKDGSSGLLVGYHGGNGNQLWQSAAAGELGAPAAQAGLVYVPFLRQWLSVVDGGSGSQITRIRGIDQEITTLRVTSRNAYYGSKLGMFELDKRSASGKRNEATYAAVKLPAQLEGTTYGRDGYDSVQGMYTAAERKRVLWLSISSHPPARGPVESGPMKLDGDGYVVHYFRFLFGFGQDGGMRWAYSHPRVELVASDHTGHAIVALSTAGELVALDPRTGSLRAKLSLGTTTPVLGATFDAEGWAPTNANEEVETVAALVSIARDRDSRFDRVKELAVQTLAKLPGGEVTQELLAVLADNRQPMKLKDAVVDLLVARRDPASLPVLTKQLTVFTDYIAGTEPTALAPVAKAIAGLGDIKLDPAQATATLAALQRHLDAPATDTSELVHVIAAMVTVGKGAERPALVSHFLLYRVDDDLGADAAWQKAIIGALANAGPGEREALRYAAADPRTKPTLAAAIRDVVVD